MSGKPYGFVMDINFKLDAPRWVETLNLKRFGNDEYHGPCPNCGGTDRFWINSYKGGLKHHCRKGCDFRSRHERLSELGLIDDSKNIEPEFRNKGNDTRPYHEKKKIELEGSGATCDGDIVVIDLFDLTTAEWRGKQFISPDGRKKFSANLVKENQDTVLSCCYGRCNRKGFRSVAELIAHLKNECLYTRFNCIYCK